MARGFRGYRVSPGLPRHHQIGLGMARGFRGYRVSPGLPSQESEFVSFYFLSVKSDRPLPHLDPALPQNRQNSARKQTFPAEILPKPPDTHAPLPPDC